MHSHQPAHSRPLLPQSLACNKCHPRCPPSPLAPPQKANRTGPKSSSQVQSHASLWSHICHSQSHGMECHSETWSDSSRRSGTVGTSLGPCNTRHSASHLSCSSQCSNISLAQQSGMLLGSTAAPP